MGYKVNHYASKTVNVGPALNIETLAIELFVGIICGAMAYGGYKAEVALLSIPCGIVTLLCFYLICHSIYQFFVDRKMHKTKSETDV